jgi:hypothetical protein
MCQIGLCLSYSESQGYTDCSAHGVQAPTCARLSKAIRAPSPRMGCGMTFIGYPIGEPIDCRSLSKRIKNERSNLHTGRLTHHQQRLS